MTAEIKGLPRWVWDLVISLQRDEDEHSRIYVMNSLTDEYEKSPWCPLVVLERIPQSVRDTAAVLDELLPARPFDSLPAPTADR